MARTTSRHAAERFYDDDDLADIFGPGDDQPAPIPRPRGRGIVAPRDVPEPAPIYPYDLPLALRATPPSTWPPEHRPEHATPRHEGRLRWEDLVALEPALAELERRCARYAAGRNGRRPPRSERDDWYRIRVKPVINRRVGVLRAWPIEAYEVPVQEAERRLYAGDYGPLWSSSAWILAVEHLREALDL